MMKKEYALYLK